jgi:hypothetical protein
MLLNILKTEIVDSSLRQNTLGALQKFSLRRKPQTKMIELDMINWIVGVLKKEHETLSDYSLE